MSLDQYLTRHAEPEAARCSGLSRRYRHVVCIPAFDETPEFLTRTLSAVPQDGVLAVVVANAPASAPRPRQARTLAIADHLRSSRKVLQRFAGNIRLLYGAGGADILLVERCAPGFFLDAREGVGTARKIACDIACRLVAQGVIGSPWIHSTDADALLPPGYFLASGGLDPVRVSAGLYPFLHLPSGSAGIDLAQRRYDQSLDYYVAGLAWAGSRWAFHTVGSTIVVSAGAYARVRGFPKRQAGEDFYLLNKLAKLGSIRTLAGDPVLLQTRLSDRVPFGTGPAVATISALADPDREFLFYHPQCFAYLRCWLALARGMWPAVGTEPLPALVTRHLRGNPAFADVSESLLLECLQALGIGDALAHAVAHSRDESTFRRHLDTWFDAFRTLKFIHWLRNRQLHSLPLAELQDYQALPFTRIPERQLSGITATA